MNHCDQDANVINGTCEIKKSKGKHTGANGWQTQLPMIRTNWNSTSCHGKKKKTHLFQVSVSVLKCVNNESVTDLDAATHKRRTSVNSSLEESVYRPSVTDKRGEKAS